jgi:hypothetical protein
VRTWPAFDREQLVATISGLKLTFRPLSPELWHAFEDLFGKQGACNGCWCMYWRIGSAYRNRPRQQNRAAFRQLVKRGPPPGLLAFDDNTPIGWCQLTPRAALPWLEQARFFKRVDNVPVWSLKVQVLSAKRNHPLAEVAPFARSQLTRASRPVSMPLLATCKAVSLA